MLHIDYWFELSSAYFEDIQIWWQSSKLSEVQSPPCLRLFVSKNHLNRFYFNKQKAVNITTFNLLSESTGERSSSTLCRHTWPQAEAFIYQTLPYQGVCCYFRPPIMLFSCLNGPEVGVFCGAANAKTHTATHTRWLAGGVVFVAWDGGAGFNTNRLRGGGGTTGARSVKPLHSLWKPADTDLVLQNSLLNVILLYKIDWISDRMWADQVIERVLEKNKNEIDVLCWICKK